MEREKERKWREKGKRKWRERSIETKRDIRATRRRHPKANSTRVAPATGAIIIKGPFMTVARPAAMMMAKVKVVVSTAISDKQIPRSRFTAALSEGRTTTYTNTSRQRKKKGKKE